MSSARMALVKKIINSKAPRAAGAPYNQAIVADRTVYCSGVLGLDRETMQLVPGGTVAQAKTAFENLKTVLAASGSSVENVVKCTVMLTNMSDFAAVNDEYKKIFSENQPARTCVEVSKLPMGASFEIEAIALTGEVKIESN